MAAAAASQACMKLKAIFPGALFVANTTQFEDQSLAIWSDTCVLTPTCVFLPSCAADIGKALPIIKKAGSRFSVRAGGHMPVPGAQSVEPGVFISLSNLNQRTLNRYSRTASIGPGQTWMEVYNWLAPYGLAVNGGRYPTVGVGGVLVGGGIGLFSSTQGWGCDNVVGFEAVLADGTIAHVTRKGKYSDLFWALRGGHNNFAIVTRFDVRYFEATSAYVKVVAWNASAQSTSEEFFSALDAYMAPGGGVDDPNVAIIPTVAAAPSLGLYEVITDQFALGTDSSPAAFANFSNVNGPIMFELGGQVFESWTKFPQLLEATGARGLRQLFWSVSFKADRRAISIANRTVIDMTFERLADAQNAAVALTYQPVSESWLKASERRGGNAIDLDPGLGTFIAGLIAIQWTDAADDARMNAFGVDVTAEIKRQTAELGFYVDFVYLNDAGPSQKPFSTYGRHGTSLQRLKHIQNRYDPDHFLDKYLAHGFALER
ncbi:FAD binding domain protein [Decorospora gaudefroyi]|uniref:FAD binding domain protein n=1 Tax=Decorospora gaudefroyi TaxID=184978 RepID=A0A6A5K734_9PLEO|nr:FAD binding domain protein [Decorospora gaudefroyi]